MGFVGNDFFDVVFFCVGMFTGDIAGDATTSGIVPDVVSIGYWILLVWE